MICCVDEQALTPLLSPHFSFAQQRSVTPILFPQHQLSISRSISAFAQQRSVTPILFVSTSYPLAGQYQPLLSSAA